MPERKAQETKRVAQNLLGYLGVGVRCTKVVFAVAHASVFSIRN